MKMPEISPDFTIEDIHKIREYNEERRKAIGDEAFWAEVRTDSLYAQEKIKEAREKQLSQERAGLNKVV
jgi:rhodanese-related sulfurtransferase